MSILFLLFIFKAINYYIVPPERSETMWGHCKRENSNLGFMYKDHMYPREFVNVAEAASLDNNQIV